MKQITIRAVTFICAHADVMFAEQFAHMFDVPIRQVRHYAKLHNVKLHYLRGELVVKKLMRRRYYFVKRKQRCFGLASYLYEYFSGENLPKGVSVRFIDGNTMNCRFDNIETFKLSDMGKNYTFKRGHKPFNKGKRGLMGPNRTSFKKGTKPKNAKYDGAISVRQKQGDPPYKYIRLKKGNWKLLHRHVWEQANGPIPRGHVVRFIDGDTMNCELSNLQLITMAENMTRNYNRDKQAQGMKAHWNKVRQYESLGMPMHFTKHRTKRKSKPEQQKRVVAIPMGDQLKRISETNSFQ